MEELDLVSEDLDRATGGFVEGGPLPNVRFLAGATVRREAMIKSLNDG